jgi:exo-1,4-beta-D-glucosaminidase
MIGTVIGRAGKRRPDLRPASLFSPGESVREGTAREERRKNSFRFYGYLCLICSLVAPGAVAADVIPLRAWKMQSAGIVPLAGWRVLKQEPAPAADAMPPADDAPGWADYHPVTDVEGGFNGRGGDNAPGFAWYAARFTLASVGQARTLLHFDSVADNATVYVNGKRLLTHEGRNTPFDVPLAPGDLHSGQNSVAVLVQSLGGMRRRSGIGGMPALIAPGDGAAIAGPDYSTQGWYSVTAPCTVMAGLVQNGEYPDLYVGKNLEKVSADRFDGPWWYRTAFRLPAAQRGRHVRLTFNGINYRAEIWVNGRQVAAPDAAVGAYRQLEYDITSLAHFGDQPNVVAVSVAPPATADLAITFVDWNPAAPDRNMGLWQDVYVTTTGPVSIRHPFVATDLALPARDSARLTVQADLTNGDDKPVTGVLAGKIGAAKFSQPVTLAAHEVRTVTFAPDSYPKSLVLAHPRLWWPWQLGKPEMYDLDLVFTVNGRASDTAATRFGIRKVTSRLNAQNRLLFTVNGVDLLILGAGYAPDLLQRRTLPDHPHWQEDRIRYVRHMNLNTIRLEGKLEDDAFYDLCDRYGVLVMPGWCCCSAWERWQNWGPEQRAVAQASLEYQIYRARTHPSMLAWLNGSDNPPPPDVERLYLDTEARLGWPCPTLSSAQEEATQVTGPSGVKMRGPYGWVPPVYWLTDHDAGGAWGFNTEVGPGATPPAAESLASFLPADHRWPMDDQWTYHAFNGRRSADDFTLALNARYGKPTGLSDYAWKAQAQAYESIRAMFEAFSRNKFDATGEIQWMLNNAWPSTTWNLYDYDLRPGGSYFGARVGSEPVHILYSYDNRSVAVTNNLDHPVSNLTATIEVINLDGTRPYRQSVPCAAPANDKSVLLTLPDLPGVTPTYFVRLTLADTSGHAVSVNSYWLSTKPDVMDWGHRDWWTTPTSAYADYTALEKLPRATLTATASNATRDGDETAMAVHVVNTGQSVAMMVRPKLCCGPSGPEVRPVFWDDGYFLLLPGESRDITVRFRRADLHGAKPVVTVDCYNNR